MSLWKRLLGRRKAGEDEPKKPGVGQGIAYLYLIIILQVVFVFGLMAVIIAIGKIMATPLWVFVFAFLLGCAGCVFIYRKAKQQFRKFRQSFQHTDLSDRNYEISIMGGMLTMRVEQNPRRLLENKPTKVIEADPVESSAAQ